MPFDSTHEQKYFLYEMTSFERNATQYRVSPLFIVQLHSFLYSKISSRVQFHKKNLISAAID